MNNPLLAIQSQYWAVRDYLSPVLKESKFKDHGRLTPEEFVAAGDFLSYKFPVWAWQKGDPSKTRDFLPVDKQYLVTRNVPCLRRATAVEYGNNEEDGERLLSFLDDAEEAPGPDGKTRSKGEEDWVETHIGRTSHNIKSAEGMAEIPDMDDFPPSSTSPHSHPRDHQGKDVPQAVHLGDLTRDIGALDLKEEVPDMDDIPDMDDELEGEGVFLEEEDEAVGGLRHPSAEEVQQSRTRENLLQVRTYDCFVTYDKHYQTPRFWLLGYDENKRPLTPTQVFQDVPSDHAFKTMTMETFPHSGQLLASVHPCKHASVMKKFIDRMDAGRKRSDSPGLGEEERVGGSGNDKEKEKEKKKKGWGLGGVVRKVTGGTGSGSVATGSNMGSPSIPGQGKEKTEDLGGVQVDFYMVIFLKFIASIVPTIEVDSTTAF